MDDQDNAGRHPRGVGRTGPGGEPMIGKRIPDITEPPFPLLKPGEYCKFCDVWFCCTPNGYAGNLAAHEVEEHEDGTVSVSPSILITRNYGLCEGDKKETQTILWHGFLKKGVWRSCDENT